MNFNPEVGVGFTVERVELLTSLSFTDRSLFFFFIGANWTKTRGEVFYEAGENEKDALRGFNFIALLDS